MAPTLEERVSTLEIKSRKLWEDDNAIYADLKKALRGVSSLGEKLRDFRDETTTNFASLRADMADGFANVRTEMDGRFAQVDSRFAQVDSRFAQMDSKLDLIIARIGAVTE